MKLSIVIPVFNEVGTVAEILRRVDKVLLPPAVEKEIIVVDDGSTDGTGEILKECQYQYRIIFRQKNGGKGAALKDGFRVASGDYILIQDADLEYNPEDYPRLLAPILEGRADIVFGSRFLRKNNVPFSRVYFYGGLFLTRLFNFLFHSRLTDMMTCYKLFPARLAPGLLILPGDDFVFDCIELTYYLLKNGRVAEVPVHYSARSKESGKKLNWRHGVRSLLAILRLRLNLCLRNESSGFAPRLLKSVLPWVAVGSLFTFMLVVSWNRWPDLIIDFSREIYTAWRLNEGAVLYKDIDHPFGPFSPYFNALALKLLGNNLVSLYAANILVILLFIALIYFFLRRATDRITAMTAVAVFTGISAFGQYIGPGNYNFMAPYSHQLVHALLAGMFCVYALSSAYRTRRKLWFFLAGLAGGVTLVTKAEIALAACITIAVFLSAYFFLERSASSRRDKVASLILLLAGLFFPVLFWLVFLAFKMPFGEAVAALLFQYKLMLDPVITSSVFYLHWRGFDIPLVRLKQLWLALSFYGLALWSIMGAAYLCQILKKHLSRPVLITSAVFTLMIVSVFSVLNPGLITFFFLPLPLVTLLLAVLLFIGWRKAKNRGAEEEINLFSMFLFSVFAFLVLLKILLFSRVFHYGFALALPALLTMTAGFVYYLPRLLGRNGAGGIIVRPFALILLAVLIWTHLLVSAVFYFAKDFAISTPYGRVVTYRNDVVSQTVAASVSKLGNLLGPNDTLAVLPEGALVNYLLGAPNPSPHISLEPLTMRMFGGEDKVLANLAVAAPTYLLVIYRNVGEFGYDYFGQPGYGDKIKDWVVKNYQPLETYGAEPFEKRFGATIFKIKEAK